MSVGHAARRLGRISLLVAVTACSSQPTPEPTPEPTTFPVASPEDAAALAADYLEAWAAGDYAAMYATLDPAQREQYPIERFTELHAAFAEMAGVAELSGTTGEPHTSALPPEPRPADYPAPTPTPAPSADPSAARIVIG